MKKSLPFLLLSVLFTSCVWFPESDAGKFREKNVIKNFNDVNSPIVFDLRIPETFSLGKKGGKYKNEFYIGSAFAVYDWEKDSVVDYIYSPELGSISTQQVLPLIKDNQGNSKFYLGSSSLNRLNMFSSVSEKINMISISDKGYVNGGITYFPYADCNCGLIFYIKSYDLDNSQTIYGLRVINPYSPSELGDELEISAADELNTEDFVWDGNNIWFAFKVYSGRKYEQITKICRVDVKENKLSFPMSSLKNNEGAVYDEYDGWSFSENYKLMYADSNALILRKSHIVNYSVEKESLFYLELSSGTMSEIQCLDNKTHCITDVLKAKDKLYDVERIYNSENEKYTANVYELNLSEKKMNLLYEDFDCDGNYFDQLCVRNNRIYLFAGEGSKVTFVYYDSDSNLFGQIKSLSVDDLKK